MGCSLKSLDLSPNQPLFGWITGYQKNSKKPFRSGAAAAAEAAEADSEDDNTARHKPHPNRGSLEYAHSMVMTACVDIRDHLGTCKQEVVLPPKELGSCKSTQLGCALLQSLEQHLFGTSLEVFINQVASKFTGLNIVNTGDAASANVKTAELLFTYVKKVAREHGLVATSCFTFCSLHQLARILSLHLERQALTAAMYSISRLHQHKSTREKTRQHLKRLLTQRFEYKVEVPPFCQFTRRLFRQHLLSLLTGAWNGEEEIDKSLTRAKLVEETLRFFNGDLSKGEAWRIIVMALGAMTAPRQLCNMLLGSNFATALSKPIASLALTCPLDDQALRTYQRRRITVLADNAVICIMYCIVSFNEKNSLLRYWRDG